jgi:ABC-type Co2+ transport system permease subunit
MQKVLRFFNLVTLCKNMGGYPMHMADALLSPTVGGMMCTATAAKTIYSARKIQNSLDNRKIPLMGFLGAFVFAAQMINFAITGTGSILAAIVGLQLGAFGVVLETYFSGISALPFSSLIFLMQPIHLGIGLVEGLATAGVISFIWKARPEIIDRAIREQPIGQVPVRNILVMFLFATGFIGGIFAW